MNIAREWLSQIGVERPEESSEDLVVDNLCFVMDFYGMSKKELDNLDIPEYLILRDYALEKTREKNKMIENMFRGK